MQAISIAAPKYMGACKISLFFSNKMVTYGNISEESHNEELDTHRQRSFIICAATEGNHNRRSLGTGSHASYDKDEDEEWRHHVETVFFAGT